MLQLDFNYLSGTIPRQLGSMFSLSKYVQIPALARYFGDWRRFHATELLDVGANNLSGTLPPALGQLLRLGTRASQAAAAYAMYTYPFVAL